MKPIPKFLQNKENEVILAYLKGKSCHGDIIEPLEKCLRKYPDVKFFCPDTANFRYCFWYYKDKIFAFGVRMNTIGLQLKNFPDKDLFAEDVRVSKEVGPGWYEVSWNSSYLEDWVREAFMALNR